MAHLLLGILLGFGCCIGIYLAKLVKALTEGIVVALSNKNRIISFSIEIIDKDKNKKKSNSKPEN